MSLPLDIRDAAMAEADAAIEHLESSRGGAGVRFLQRMNSILTYIAAMPEMYGVVWRNVRAVCVPRSEYIIYYVVHLDRVEVFAIVHAKREPSAWRDRAPGA